MAVPYHTHTFDIPTATDADVAAGIRSDVAVVPANLGTASQSDVGDFATAAQGTLADSAVQPGDLGDSAGLDVGTTAGTVAAGDDSRINGAAQKSENLSDLTNSATARSNLGLGGSAVLNVGTTAGTVAAGDDSRIANALQPGAADSNTNFLQAGTGATTRTTRNKNRDVINVLDFGAVGDGTTNDAAAIQAAIDHLKSISGNTRPTLVFGSEGGSRRQFKVTSTLNFTQMRDVGFIVDLNGSVLIGATNGQPVIDALDSEHIEFRDGSIFGQDTQTPNYGIQIGRGISGQGAAYMSLRRINFTGSYTSACLLNSASEISRFEKCNFWNGDDTTGNACVIQDGRRAVHVTSQFFTVTQANDTISSHNDNLFTNCTFEKIDGVGDGYALKIYGTSRAHNFINCYAQNANGATVYSSGDHVGLELDLHCEQADLENNIVIDAPNGSTSLWRDCIVKEYYMFCTDALIKGIGGTGNIFFTSCEISVQDAALNKPVFNKNGTTVRYHGKIYLGNSPSNGTYNLSTLDALNGDIFCSAGSTNLVLPSVGAFRVTDFNSVEQRQVGLQRFFGTLALEPGSSLTVSAGVLTIPLTASRFSVSSGGNINSITVGSSDRGRVVFLSFGYSGTLSNSVSAAKTVLAGSYNFVANNTILLYCDGSLWIEVTRCLNVAA